MKYFLDENFPKKAAEFLLKIGDEVIDIRSTDKEGLDDYSIFQMAVKESAVFLTTDRDFFHTIPFHFTKHPGIIVIALNQPNRKNILAKLKWVLTDSGINDFQNQVILLRDNNYIIRK